MWHWRLCSWKFSFAITNCLFKIYYKINKVQFCINCNNVKLLLFLNAWMQPWWALIKKQKNHTKPKFDSSVSEDQSVNYLVFTVHIFLIIWIQQVYHPKVWDLYYVVTLEQHVACSEVPMGYAVLFKIIHSLKMHTDVVYKHYAPIRFVLQTISDLQSSHLCNLHTPVEQTLGIQAVFVLAKVLQ